MRPTARGAAALALAAALLLAPGAHAKERDPQDAAPGELFAPWVHGAARYKGYFYADEGRQENDRARSQGEIDLDLTPSLHELLPGLRAEVLYRVVYDDEHLSAGVFDDRDTRRPIVNVREAFLAWEGDTLEARVGKQVFAWGKADLHNPTDTLNARGYSDLLDNEKIGSWSVAVRWLAPGEIALEAVFIPFHFIPARLPPRGARFDLVPPDFPVPLEDRDIPPDTFEISQVGLRAQGTIDALALDWSVSAYSGRDDIPNTRVEVTPIPVPPFGIPKVTPYYKRQQVVGASLSRAIESFEVHVEAGYFFHAQRDEDEYVEYVAGVNFRSADLFDPSDELFLVLEYAGQCVTVPADEDVVENLFRPIVKSTILTRARYALWGGDLVVEATAAILMHGPDNQFYQAKASYLVTDWAKVTVGGDILAGAKDGFFGQFREDDRGFVVVEMAF